MHVTQQYIRPLFHPTAEGGASASLPERQLQESFFDRSADIVARDLIGKIIVSNLGGVETSGIIVETHAYTGANDNDTHLYRGESSQSTEWKPGSLYIYSTQGNAILTIAAPPYDEGAAVLIRAIEPVSGFPEMRSRRNGASGVKVSQGPGNVAKALGITLDLNGTNIFEENGISIISGIDIESDELGSGPRVKAKQNPDTDLRFYIRNNKWVGSPRS